MHCIQSKKLCSRNNNNIIIKRHYYQNLIHQSSIFLSFFLLFLFKQTGATHQIVARFGAQTSFATIFSFHFLIKLLNLCFIFQILILIPAQYTSTFITYILLAPTYSFSHVAIDSYSTRSEKKVDHTHSNVLVQNEADSMLFNLQLLLFM